MHKPRLRHNVMGDRSTEFLKDTRPSLTITAREHQREARGRAPRVARLSLADRSAKGQPRKQKTCRLHTRFVAIPGNSGP